MSERGLPSLLAIVLIGALAGCARNHGDSAESDAAMDRGAAAAAADASNDPGDPGVRYGTIAQGTLFVADDEVGKIHYTAAAPNRDDRSHLFAVVSPAESVGVTEDYLSLVFDESAWRTGTYDRAVGGRGSFETSNGKRYAANGSELDLTLTVTAASAGETEFYIKGELDMEVPSVNSGDPALRVEVTSL